MKYEELDVSDTKLLSYRSLNLISQSAVGFASGPLYVTVQTLALLDLEIGREPLYAILPSIPYSSVVLLGC